MCCVSVGLVDSMLSPDSMLSHDGRSHLEYTIPDASTPWYASATNIPNPILEPISTQNNPHRYPYKSHSSSS